MKKKLSFGRLNWLKNMLVIIILRILTTEGNRSRVILSSNLIATEMKSSEMEFTPKDLVKVHNLDKIGWTFSDLGTLLKLGLVKGNKIHRKNLTYIDEESLLKLLETRDEILKSQMFNNKIR